MGRYTVNFKCHSCGHCCTEVVCLPTPWDVIRLVKGTKQNPYKFLEFLTPEEIKGVDKGDPTWLKVNGEKYLMALRRDDKGCHFLDPKTKFCSVYESRPILCRLYPFKLLESRSGEFKGFSLHTNGIGCPKNRDSVYETGPLHELYLDDKEHQDDYMDLVKVFNRRRDPDKRPQDFIEMFVTGFKAPSR